MSEEEVTIIRNVRRGESLELENLSLVDVLDEAEGVQLVDFSVSLERV